MCELNQQESSARRDTNLEKKARILEWAILAVWAILCAPDAVLSAVRGGLFLFNCNQSNHFKDEQRRMLPCTKALIIYSEKRSGVYTIQLVQLLYHGRADKPLSARFVQMRGAALLSMREKLCGSALPTHIMTEQENLFCGLIGSYALPLIGADLLRVLAFYGQGCTSPRTAALWARQPPDSVGSLG